MSLQVSTPTDTTIVLTRTFNAPRRLVWEAFFVPEKMRRWMLPPPGWTLTVCECEARAGGKLRLAWKSAEADPAMTLQGVFTEAVMPERAIHTEKRVWGGWEGAGQVVGSQLEKHEFFDVAGKSGVTTMRITQTYETKEARDGAVASGQEQGMEAGYKQLDAVLARGG
ncbi:MAG TPA: SRPBCC domain-containing protein [Phycisphaerales bacterium]|nr:SRPBCC domain-containing protein [Phycisphaerales bacterium]